MELHNIVNDNYEQILVFFNQITWLTYMSDYNKMSCLIDFGLQKDQSTPSGTVYMNRNFLIRIL